VHGRHQIKDPSPRAKDRATVNVQEAAIAVESDADAIDLWRSTDAPEAVHGKPTRRLAGARGTTYRSRGNPRASARRPN